MAKAKKTKVKALKTFFDKKENVRRKKGDVFEVTAKRLEEIQKFEADKKIELIEIADTAAGLPEGESNESKN